MEDRKPAHRKGLAIASLTVLVVDVYALLALAVIVPFLIRKEMLWGVDFHSGVRLLPG